MRAWVLIRLKHCSERTEEKKKNLGRFTNGEKKKKNEELFCNIFFGRYKKRAASATAIHATSKPTGRVPLAVVDGVGGIMVTVAVVGNGVGGVGGSATDPGADVVDGVDGEAVVVAVADGVIRNVSISPRSSWDKTWQWTTTSPG
jgi:hypothetical protein